MTVPAYSPLSNPALSSNWTTFTYALTDADRQNLIQARGIRLVIQEAVGGTAGGEIIIDSITIEGTPFWPQTVGTDNGTMSMFRRF